MKMLMDSPAIVILRWVQKQFPILKPPGVKDSFPLMQQPAQQPAQQLQQQTNTTSIAANVELIDTKH